MPKLLYSESISIATLDKLVYKSNYRVEMHHVRIIKNLLPKTKDLDALMAKANR